MEIISKGNKHYIKWYPRPISRSDFVAIADKVNKDRDYSLDNDKKQSLMRFTIKKEKLSLSVEQALSIGRIININKITKNYNKVMHQINNIKREYKNGTDILALSKKYDFPPLTILYNIFETSSFETSSFEQSISMKDIKALFKGTSDYNPLTGRDLEQYDIAERNDATGAHNQKLNTEKSMQNEMIFNEYWRKLGIKFKTENDLKREQIAERGNAFSTPDILFIDEVYINDERIFWLDYKDYIGTDIPILYQSNKKQAHKYNLLWGHGAFCYKYSFIEGLKFDDTVILDGSIL